MARGKKKRQHVRRATDPGSSTEEEFKETHTDTFGRDSSVLLQRRVQRSTHQKSLIFHVIRYPLLVIITILCFLNLVLYTTSRLLVAFLEYAWSFFNRTIYWKERQLYDSSKTYQEFFKRAQILDKESGASSWKTEQSDEVCFDESLLVSITKRLQRDYSRNHIAKLMETLRNSACKQDLAGIENEILYSRCYIGTKHTVDQFVHEVITSLEHVYESKEISTQAKADFFKQVSVTYGRTALCLSGGATLGYFHLGVMKALWEQGLLPLIITGTSSGAMMASMVNIQNNKDLISRFVFELTRSSMKYLIQSYLKESIVLLYPFLI